MARNVDNDFADLARGDCNHDFGTSEGVKAGGLTDPAFLFGLVGVSKNNWNEDTCMEKTLGIPRNDWLKDAPPTVIYPHNTTVTIKKVVFLSGDKPTGKALVEALGIQNAVLCVDFNHHGFLSKLHEGAPAADVTVGYVYSAATVNDPASKTPPGETIFKDKSKGVNLIAYRQTSGATLFPGGKPYLETEPTQNFISKHDVTISGIMEKKSFGKRAKDTVTLTFTQGANTATISDSKGQNSPAQLNSFISKLKALFNRAGVDQAAKVKFDLSTKWQQKRSGDWLQAIHAATLDRMTFSPPLPLQSKPFFVSHDRIAIAYALRLKVNCLFFSDDDIYVFDFNPANPETSEQRTARCVAALEPLNGDYTTVKQWWKSIHDNVDAAQGVFKTAIDTEIANLTSPTIKLAALEKAIQTILTNAVSHANYGGLLPRIQDAVDPCEDLNRYYTLKKIFTQHDGNTFIPTAFTTAFQKSNIYRSANEWRIIPKQSIANRLFSAVSMRTNETDKRDNYLFFPFLQNALDTTVKNTILAGLVRLHTTLNAGGLDQATTDRLLPKFKLGLTSFLTQAYIFLKDVDVIGPDAEFITRLETSVAMPDTGLVRGTRAELEAPELVNEMRVVHVVETKATKYSASEDTLENSEVQNGGQKGGWLSETQPKGMFLSIDADQCADPILYAMVDTLVSKSAKVAAAREEAGAAYKAALAAAEAANTAEAEQGSRNVIGGRRRALYGGSESGTSAIDIIYICILLVATRITRDSWKLGDAPPYVLEYYYKGTQLLNLLTDIEKTEEHALAVRELTTQCMFMTDEDIAAAFSMDVSDASVYRLFFSALEESPLIEAPLLPAEFLQQATSVLTETWNAVGNMPADTSDETIRALSESITRKITTHYLGEQSPPIPPSEPMPIQVSPQTPFTPKTRRIRPSIGFPPTPQKSNVERITALADRRTGGTTRRTRRSTTP